MSRPAGTRAKPRARRRTTARRRSGAKRPTSAAALTRRRAARRRGRLRALRMAGIVASIIVAASLLVLVPVAISHDAAPVCADDPSTYPEEGIRGWSGEQLENAVAIMRTAREMGFDRQGEILGVMTAMGESSLRNIDYGDWETNGITNPDGSRTSSIGLFQQQDWWGSPQTRMDPAGAASLFYARLAALPGWQEMEPTIAIHRVQINADPQHYARFEQDAALIVALLSRDCATPAG